MRIGIDIDNVIFNTAETVLDVHYEDTGERLHLSDITDYNMTQFVSKKYRYKFHELFSDSRVVERLKPIENCVETINNVFGKQRYDILFVTASPIYIQPNGRKKLQELFDFDISRRIVVTKNKSVVDIDILIDDCPNYISDHVLNRNDPAILFKYPWNQKPFIGETLGLSYRTDNWKDIDKLIFIMANFHNKNRGENQCS